MTNSLNFTKSDLTKLEPIAGKSRTYVYDTRVNGLCLSITPAGTKSFLVYRKLNGKPIRVTLGRFPDMTIEQARKAALEALSGIAGGVNLIEEKRVQRIAGITLKEVMSDYVKVRGHTLSSNTKSNYQTILNTHLYHWQDKPMADITRDMVAKCHRELSESSESAANKSMRVLRALFNFANGQYEGKDGKGLFPDNPVSRLTHTRSWNKETRRDNKIKSSELETWFQAVRSLHEREDEFARVASDYLIFLLLTGLRRREAASLEWKNVDFKERSFLIPNTKNGTALTLPMTDYVNVLLQKRKSESSGPKVFQSNGAKGHIDDPRRIVEYVREKSGVYFTLHDIRRTYISIAESLDISAYAIKKLVNHSTGGDVTAGYIIMDVERLRAPMQKITDVILKFSGIKLSAEILSLNAKKEIV